MNQMKLLFHVHSSYSYDSLNSISSIIKYCEKNGIECLAITDHDTIDGSMAARRFIKEEGRNIQVITAAEYLSNCGDIIGMFLSEEIKERSWGKIIDEIHRQGGIAVLPHPYHAHKQIDEIAQKVDFIETFNPRCSEEQNNKALALAKKYNKPGIYGADAHRLSELSNAINSVKYCDKINGLDVISSQAIRVTSKYGIYVTQMIKGLKKKSLLLILKSVKSILSYYLIQPFKRKLR